MENEAAPINPCPHCGSRLVAGASICLVCNEEVAPQKADGENATGRFITIALVIFAIIGGISMVVIQLVTDAGEARITKPVTFDESEMSDIICVDEEKTDQIGALTAKGLNEVAGKPGTRCFSEK